MTLTDLYKNYENYLPIDELDTMMKKLGQELESDQIKVNWKIRVIKHLNIQNGSYKVELKTSGLIFSNRIDGKRASQILIPSMK